MGKPRIRRQGEGTDPTRAAVRGAQRAHIIATHGVHIWSPPAHRYTNKTADRRACRGPIRGD